MKKAKPIVLFVSLFLMIYSILPLIGVAESILFLLFSVSPFLVIYMVYVVLKHGKPSSHSFEEKFYDDMDYRRNGQE